MTAVCPAGHTSESEDYCDVCGMPIGAVAVTPGGPPPPAPPNHAPTSPAAPAPGPAPQTCPNCSTVNSPEALFCENCGYDFTTGTAPRPLTPPEGVPAPVAVVDGAAGIGSAEDGAAPPAGSRDGVEWVAEVWIDPAWYEAQESPDPLPSPGPPAIVPLRDSSLLVGRRSRSRGIHPAIDCEADSGVSRRQAQLTTDGDRWWVEDLESANGTFVAPASAPLPTDPIPVGLKRELAVDDRVYLGAWTRLVIRPATDEERTGLG